MMLRDQKIVTPDSDKSMAMPSVFGSLAVRPEEFASSLVKDFLRSRGLFSARLIGETEIRRIFGFF
jgi:hypothetical protein